MSKKVYYLNPEELESYRKKNALSVSAFAKLIGMTRKTVTYLLKGARIRNGKLTRHGVNAESKDQIRDRTGIPEDRLLSKSDANQWAHCETAFLGSDEIKDVLIRQQNNSILLVDQGALLYHAPSFAALDPNKIHFQGLVKSCTLEMRDPDRKTLERQIAAENHDAAIAAYLRARIPESGEMGRFQTKVGLRRLVPPAPIIEQLLTLHISPVSYWTMREFNRKMLDQPNPPLRKLHGSSLGQALGVAEACQLEFPSALYVSVAVWTADDLLLVVEKNPTLSPLARRGMRFSTTFEEGLSWARHSSRHGLAFLDAAIQGAKRELEIEEEDIASIDLMGVALECTHLNASALGVMRLNLRQVDLLPRLGTTEDFTPNVRFLSRDEVLHSVLAAPQLPQWHPTARLRCLLSLYQSFGVEKTRQMLTAARGRID